MKIDFTLTDLAIEEIESKGQQVTLKKIAEVSGYSYYELYNSRKFKQYVRPSSFLVHKRIHANSKNPAAPITTHPQIQKTKDDEAVRLAKEALSLASVPPVQPRHPHFPADGSCKMTWRATMDGGCFEINIIGVKEDDWFNREVAAFMCLEAYNKLMGRSGERKIREDYVEAFKP